MMYNLVNQSIVYYKNIMQGEGYRERLADALLLITDTKKYYEAKENKDSVYRNLCDIVYRMKELYSTGEDKYHHFSNFLREVEDAGYDINAMEAQNVTESTKLNDQIELIMMLMCFRYHSIRDSLVL